MSLSRLPKIDQSIISRFHDAELIGVEMDREHKNLNLKFKLSNSELETIIFRKVAVFRILDLIPQNVVSRLLFSSMEHFSKQNLEYWIKWVGSLSDGVFITSEQVGEFIERINNKRMELFVLEPSFGAEVAVICEDIVVR